MSPSAPPCRRSRGAAPGSMRRARPRRGSWRRFSPSSLVESRCGVPSPERRSALGAGKVARPHPAEPAALSVERAAPGDQGLVMLCVRVTPALRKRLKLASAASGRSIQAIATDALERLCMQADVREACGRIARRGGRLGVFTRKPLFANFLGSNVGWIRSHPHSVQRDADLERSRRHACSWDRRRSCFTARPVRVGGRRRRSPGRSCRASRGRRQPARGQECSAPPMNGRGGSTAATWPTPTITSGKSSHPATRTRVGDRRAHHAQQARGVLRPPVTQRGRSARRDQCASRVLVCRSRWGTRLGSTM
jgi:hypothetical protein